MKYHGALRWLMVLGVLALVGGAAYYAILPQLRPHMTMRLGDGVFNTQVVKEQGMREKGLGGTFQLSDDQAMLLVYGDDGKWSVSMKDMKFPIDIVWLDRNKKVVYIVKNAPPESYPYEEFSPKKEARYVMLSNAGTVAKTRIAIDKIGDFDENKLEGWGQ